MKTILLTLMLILAPVTFSQKTQIEVFNNSDSITSHYENDSFIEWKTSHEATVLHCVEYASDSTILEHKKYNILSIEDDNVSVIIKIDSEKSFIMYFWKDHSKVMYQFDERYTIITGDLKF